MAKPVIIEIKKTRHKTQPYTVRIEQGKTDIILSQRYVSKEAARRGGMRKLNACTVPHKYDGRLYRYCVGYSYQTPSGRPIKVVHI